MVDRHMVHIHTLSLSPSSLTYSRGCQTQEKVVAACAKTFVVIADYR